MRRGGGAFRLPAERLTLGTKSFEAPPGFWQPPGHGSREHSTGTPRGAHLHRRPCHRVKLFGEFPIHRNAPAFFIADTELELRLFVLQALSTAREVLQIWVGCSGLEGDSRKMATGILCFRTRATRSAGPAE